MARFKKNIRKDVPTINTGSMSDIIFMFLFFFMVITNIRETTLFVKYTPPKATDIQKLEKKSMSCSIYIGQPVKTAVYGTEPRIQLNDQLAEVADVQEFILKERAARPENVRQLLNTILKVDKNVKMGIISDIKLELRKANALRITYATFREAKKAEN
ncbi:MAG: biopolymer transporter ExbD [Bacteroidetes bacterium]|nr:biopolymer transporter ExbD [Bacteroidota bacterium]